MQKPSLKYSLIIHAQNLNNSFLFDQRLAFHSGWRTVQITASNFLAQTAYSVFNSFLPVKLVK